MQNEYSLLYRVEAEETLRTTRELGIAFVAYAPLGRGMLTAKIEDPSTLADNDSRRRHPRYAEGNLAHNVALVHRIEAIAQRKGCTPGQLALAWLLAQGPDVIPIPGTKRKERLLENLGALAVSLTQERRRGDIERNPGGRGGRHALPGATDEEPLSLKRFGQTSSSAVISGLDLT